MSGKMYFWYNYVKLQDVEFGLSRPDFRVCQQYWFDEIQKAQDSREWGLIGVKRRRIGASWLETADVLHDAITRPGVKLGMTSKSETDAVELFKKVKFIYDNLPEWLRPTTSSGNSRMHMDFSYREKDSKGNWVKRGTRSEIVVRAPTDTAFEGYGLAKFIADEIGKYPVRQLFSYTEPAMMKGTRRVGTPILFGTAGDITKEGADFKAMFDAADTYKLRQFFFGGWMGLDGLVDEYGNDMVEEAVRWVIYERFRKESLGIKEYTDFIQQFPLTVQEAFTSNETYGVGNQFKISKQLDVLTAKPPFKKHGYFRLDANQQPVFVPAGLGPCIIYEEPDPAMQDLYIGGCLPPGEMVATSSGLRPVEDVTFLDKLISIDGDAVPITKIYNLQKEDETVYTFRVANTWRTTTFTGEHPIFSSRSSKLKKYNKVTSYYFREELYYEHNFAFNRADTVQPGDWLRVPNIYKKEILPDFTELWNSKIRVDFNIASPLEDVDFWWLFGLIAGDGWAASHDAEIGIVINSMELGIKDKAISVITQLLGRSPTVRLRNNCFTLTFHSKQLSAFIKENLGQGAENKRIASWIKHLPARFKIATILGYLDSDGCVSIHKKRQNTHISFVSISQQLLEDIQDMLFGLGIVSGLHRLRDSSVHRIDGHKPSVTRPCYTLSMGHHSSAKFQGLSRGFFSYKMPKTPLPMRRKLSKQGCYLEDSYIYFRVEAITQTKYTGTVYNFECETHTFMCRNIPTHNCDSTDHEVKNPDSKAISGHSMFIMKKRRGMEPPKIVFEIFDRPKVPRDFYDQALLACLYYNKTKVLVERNKPGIITYFDENGFKHLLATKPQGYSQLIQGTTWNIGIYMDKKTKLYGEECVSEYIEDHIEWIPSKELLKECQEYGQRNTDRVSSLMVTLIYLKEDKWEASERNSNEKFFKKKLIKGPDGIPRRVSN